MEAMPHHGQLNERKPRMLENLAQKWRRRCMDRNFQSVKKRHVVWDFKIASHSNSGPRCLLFGKIKHKLKGKG